MIKHFERRKGRHETKKERKKERKKNLYISMQRLEPIST
jgi:hypothetical protein